MRTPLVIMAVLVALLLGLDAVTSSPSSSKAPRRPRPATPVATIARRVEAIRHLRYRRLPVPQRVSPAQARRDGLADFDKSEPPRRQAGEEEVLELLGLARPGTSLRQVAASLYGEGVAGYYDPRSKRLKVVTGAATSTPVLAETVLAHELTHALEDQRFGLLSDEGRVSGDDDSALAATALIEGSATEVMQRYSVRWFSRSQLLAGAIASAFAPTGDLPPFLESQTLFPYLAGQAFVEYLLRRAGGRWDLVDTAERLRPPASTEQVMHPAAYLRADQPLRVRLRPSLGRGWRRALSGTWGELQTRDMLRLGGAPDAARAAAGWGGDRWELWRSRPLAERSCAAPCRAADVLIMRWRWDTPRDEHEFAAALRGWAANEKPASGHAIADDHGAVTLALAPDQALARRAARAGG